MPRQQLEQRRSSIRLEILSSAPLVESLDGTVTLFRERGAENSKRILCRLLSLRTQLCRLLSLRTQPSCRGADGGVRGGGRRKRLGAHHPDLMQPRAVKSLSRHLPPPTCVVCMGNQEWSIQGRMYLTSPPTANLMRHEYCEIVRHHQGVEPAANLRCVRRMISATFLESWGGTRQSFPGEWHRKFQTHRTARRAFREAHGCVWRQPHHFREA
jgi:hypothetical protein